MLRVLADTWQRITSFGSERFTRAEEKRAHGITGAGYLLTIVLLIVVGVVLVYQIHSRVDIDVLQQYVIIFIIGLSALFIAYLVHRRTRKLLLSQFVLLAISFATLAVLTTATGPDTGISLYFYILAAYPLFFPGFRFRIRLIFSVLTLLSGLFFVFVLIRLVPPWLPFEPEVIAAIAPSAMISAAICAAILGAYLWWHFSVTSRLWEIWVRLSLVGVDSEMEANARKERITLNRMSWLVIVGGVYLAIFSMIFYFDMLARGREISWVFYANFGPMGFFIFLAAFLIWRHSRTSEQQFFLSSALYLMSIIIVTFACISFGREWGYHFLFFALFIPIVALPAGHKLMARIILGTNLTGLIAVQVFYRLGEPLWPMPNEFAAPISYYSALTLSSIVLLYITYTNWKENHELQDALAQAKEKAEEEREKSDRLLLNILPEEVAHELKETGSAKPIRYESVTVVFTDFVGFTKIAETLRPVELIKELDLCFSYFDMVIRKYNLEKIKTIGDSYMFAGGLPRANSTHAIDCVLAAMEVQGIMRQLKENKEQMGLPYWELRLGIHTGPLVAGVIGEMKFAYDVFGDTVNTASRLESAGIAGEINISGATLHHLNDLFVCEARGKVSAKHKGEIEMHLVRSLKPEFSRDGEGRVPNDDFRLSYDNLAEEVS